MHASSLTTALSSLRLGEIISLVAMENGTSPVFKIEFAARQPLVLKVYSANRLGAARKEAFATSLLPELRVPVTRFILLDDTEQRLPFPFAITNYLPGIAAGQLRDHPDAVSLYRQMGELLRSLHSVSMLAYGAFDAQGIVSPVSANAEFVRRLIEHTFQRFCEMGAKRPLAQRLRIIVEDWFTMIVPHSNGAVFAHDDLHPNNVLAVQEADGKLRLSGLIDFGNARAADPVFDLAKCLFCSEHDAPGSTPHILEGYGEIDHPNPEAALSYYTLLHRMTMWWWLRDVGAIRTADAPNDLMQSLTAVAASSDWERRV